MTEAELQRERAANARAIAGAAKAVRSIETLMATEAGAQKERDERAEELATEVRDELRALPAKVAAEIVSALRDAPQRAPTAVEQSIEDLKVETIRTPLGIIVGAKRAVSALVTWAAQNPKAATALASGWTIALGGFLLQLADGAPFLAALGRALLALGGVPAPTSAGGAP